MRLLARVEAGASAEAISSRLVECALLQRCELHGAVHALIARDGGVGRALRQMLAVESLHLDALELGQIVLVLGGIIIMLLTVHAIIVTIALLVIDGLLPCQVFLVESIHFISNEL